jgi:thioredoxin-like negative regulator of GroEL
VTYTEPITMVAAQAAPSPEDASKMTEKSESFIVDSQAAFKQGNYLKALDFANKAVGEAPGDGALHEYRALVLFALGKYSEAAGVLNPVLAGGPGWDWTTMVSLYNSQDTYKSQLQALEKYSKAKPQAADAHFLLGYQYMVCGQLEQATAEFAEAAKLQPADSVSAQLRDLTKASSNNGAADQSDDAQTPTEAPPPPTPVPLEKLTGTWVSDKGNKGTVTLVFKDDGKFIWTYKNGGKSNQFDGVFSMNDNGLLVLDAKQSQMVASVEIPQDKQLKFVLAGGPPGDPGLVFTRK